MFNYLFLNLFFSLVGMGYFMFGKRQTELWFMIAGVGLMIFTYLFSGILLLLTIGAALMALPFVIRRWEE